jgi:glycerophosphoryl diester phosphodiesterase
MVFDVAAGPPTAADLDCTPWVLSSDPSAVAAEATVLDSLRVEVELSGALAGSSTVEIGAGHSVALRIQALSTDSQTLLRAVAHRGAGFLAPENTLAALRLAVDYPVPGVEYDVRLTRDSVPVLLHDPTTDRTTGVSARIAELSFQEASRLDAAWYFFRGRSPEPIPSLAQALELLRGTTVPLVLIEIKHDAAFSPGAEAAAVIPLIRAYGMIDRTLIYSSSRNVVEAVRALDSTVRLGFSFPFYASWHREFISRNRVEAALYPVDSLMLGDISGPGQLRQDGVEIIGYGAVRVREADEFTRQWSGSYVLADSVPALFAIPRAPGTGSQRRN